MTGMARHQQREKGESNTKLELEKFREFLGPGLASQYSDGELAELRSEMTAMAEFLLDLYLFNKQHGQTKNAESFDTSAQAL